jgi:drug/metabolite transporter (DMT)-like permease
VHLAVLTALLFGITPVLASRSARLLGAGFANFSRLVLAGLILGGWTLLGPGSAWGPSADWFLLGGIAGFGVGGVAMFQSLVRLGPNLSNLAVQCLSVLAAALLEWLWLGTTLSPAQILLASLCLLGVAIGLLPSNLPHLERKLWLTGLLWSLLSALGQGCGAVFSRKAFQVARAFADPVNPGIAAFERVLGGLLIASLALFLEWLWRRLREQPAGLLPDNGISHRAWTWVLANALTGPVLGVTFYQWALRGHPAGIVQAIVAAAPLLTIPLAAWIEGERPRFVYFVGAPLSVAAIAGLWLCM